MELAFQLCCGLAVWMRIFWTVFMRQDHSPGSEFFPSRIRIKEFKYSNTKNCFYALGNMVRAVHPGSRSLFYQSRIPDPGVKKAPDPGSGSSTLVLLRIMNALMWTITILVPNHGNSVVDHDCFDENHDRPDANLDSFGAYFMTVFMPVMTFLMRIMNVLMWTMTILVQTMTVLMLAMIF
jgi:hypothetical protein